MAVEKVVLVLLSIFLHDFSPFTSFHQLNFLLTPIIMVSTYYFFLLAKVTKPKEQITDFPSCEYRYCYNILSTYFVFLLLFPEYFLPNPLLRYEKYSPTSGSFQQYFIVREANELCRIFFIYSCVKIKRLP